MRPTNLLCVLVLFLAGCGSLGALYLPDGQIEQVRRVSMEDETFQPETPQQELQNRDAGQEEDENEGVYEDVDVFEDEDLFE